MSLYLFAPNLFSHLTVLDAAGLTAALVLRRNGVFVRLIEKALEYHIGVRGNGVQVSGLECSSLYFVWINEFSAIAKDSRTIQDPRTSR